MSEPVPSKNLLPFKGEVRHFPNVLTSAKEKKLFCSLKASAPWRQESIKIFGKTVAQPRLSAWYADAGAEYAYSGLLLKRNDWSEDLRALKELVQESTGERFNSALLNLYRDGNDYMGWHRDDEKELGANPVIASLSLGTRRDFCLRPWRSKRDKSSRAGDPKVIIPLEGGDMLLMSGETQHYWEHSLPKRTAAKEARINITFRRILA